MCNLEAKFICGLDGSECLTKGNIPLAAIPVGDESVEFGAGVPECKARMWVIRNGDRDFDLKIRCADCQVGPEDEGPSLIDAAMELSR